MSTQILLQPIILVGASSLATSGFFTVSRIFSRTKLAAVSFASASKRISLKAAKNVTPPLDHRSSYSLTRSFGSVSMADRVGNTTSKAAGLVLALARIPA